MPTPSWRLDDPELILAWEIYQKHGGADAVGSVKKAADELGLNRNTLNNRLKSYRRLADIPEGIKSALEATGTTPATGRRGWRVVVDPKTGSRDSVYWDIGTGDEMSLVDTVRQAFQDLRDDQFPIYPPRPKPSGSRLLAISLADVHIGKLCVQSETGFKYNRDVAVHRMVEGTRRLLLESKGQGIGRILLMLGNDILHTDNAQGTTTNGTPQDTDGSIRQMYSDAFAAYVRVIEMCRETAPVDLIYVPSNHDWLMGWALAGQVGTWFRNDKRVSATEYNMNALHRKYYRFDRNFLGLTHGNGAKEADLYPLMVTEGREHISECPHLYWYVHHTHHKDRRAQGVLPHKREKDHIGMTMMKVGRKTMEGDNVMIETVRSPSAPDFWHHTHGHINRQAVECFVHDAEDGQVGRFTAWF